MVSSPETASRMSRSEWLVVILLVASVLINYVDRGNLSIAAPVLEKQLALSPLQIGALLSAFFWTYSLLQLFGVAGWLADHFSVGMVFALGFFVWSAATMLTGLVTGFAFLYAMRLLLGVGESIAYPCYSKVFAELPQEHRGRPNALIDAGTKVGPAVGAFAGGLILLHFGWRLLFIALGLVSLLWLIPWLRFMPRPQPNTLGPDPLPSFRELLSKREAWGTFLGHFCGDYFFYFLLTWLPLYLVRERKIPLAEMIHITAAMFLLVAGSTVAAGWISDRLIARGVSPTRVRRNIVVGGLSVASILAVFGFTNSLVPSLTILAIAAFGYGVFASNHWAIAQTLSGPRMAGRWTSVQNGIGNLSGIAGPWVAGFVVEKRGSSRIAFLVCGLVALAGAFIWGFMVPRVEPVKWASDLAPLNILDNVPHPARSARPPLSAGDHSDPKGGI